MSDLRSRLIAAFVKWEWTAASISHESFIDTVLPIIEAELQKEQREIARWVRSCQSLVEENTEANKLLEQTIDVLEGWQPNWRWHDEQAKPLLDNLKARKP